MTVNKRALKDFFRLRQLVVIPVAFLLALLVAEAALHFRPLPHYIFDFIFTQAGDAIVHQPSADPKILVELKPGARFVFEEPGKPKRTVSINSFGVRGPERSLKKPPGVFRILMLGSSMLYGAVVSDDETITSYMEANLNARGDGRRYEVWNAGVSSFAPQQMTALGARLVRRGIEPDAIFFQIFLLGPRAFLVDHIDMEMYKRDPSLFGEHFALPDSIPYGPVAWLAARSRLALLFVAHYNRMLTKKERDAEKHPFIMAHHRDAIENFGREFGKIPMAAFNIPCDTLEDSREIKNLTITAGMHFWCIPAPEQTKDYMEGHPLPYVNRFWAEKIVARMDEDGFLRR